MVTGSLWSQCRFGITGGLNFNNIEEVSTESIEQWKSATSFHAGITYQAQLPFLGFAVQPELLFVRNSSEGLGGMEDLNVDYLMLPVNLQLGVDLVLFRPFIIAGPYVSYAISKGGFLENDDWQDLNRVDYGFTLGLGIDFWRVQLSGKYVKGLGKITEAEVPTLESLRGATNGGFHVSLAFLF